MVNLEWCDLKNKQRPAAQSKTVTYKILCFIKNKNQQKNPPNHKTPTIMYKKNKAD